MARGVREAQATHIFDLMEKFAGYGFNKSHSAAYALLSYQTAWLKAHYPAAFMAAVLSADMDKTDKVVTLIDECASMGLTVHAAGCERIGVRLPRRRPGAASATAWAPSRAWASPRCRPSSRSATPAGRSRICPICAAASICSGSTGACSRR